MYMSTQTLSQRKGTSCNAKKPRVWHIGAVAAFLTSEQGALCLLQNQSQLSFEVCWEIVHKSVWFYSLLTPCIRSRFKITTLSSKVILWGQSLLWFVNMSTLQFLLGSNGSVQNSEDNLIVGSSFSRCTWLWKWRKTLSSWTKRNCGRKYAKMSTWPMPSRKLTSFLKRFWKVSWEKMYLRYGMCCSIEEISSVFTRGDAFSPFIHTWETP